VASGVLGSGMAVDCWVSTMAGEVGLEMLMDVSDRLMKLVTYAMVPALLMMMPCGAFPGIWAPATACRSTRTTWLGPATSGLLTVGMPFASKVRRTTTSEFWI